MPSGSRSGEMESVPLKRLIQRLGGGVRAGLRPRPRAWAGGGRAASAGGAGGGGGDICPSAAGGGGGGPSRPSESSLDPSDGSTKGKGDLGGGCRGRRTKGVNPSWVPSGMMVKLISPSSRSSESDIVCFWKPLLLT